MIICSDEELKVGSTQYDMIGNAQGINVAVHYYVKRTATKEEWIAYAIETNSIHTTPLYDYFYEIVAD